MTTPPPSLTLEELAARWGVSKRKVQDMRSQGQPMPRQAAFLGRRPVRFLLTEVERFEHEQGMSPQGE